MNKLKTFVPFVIGYSSVMAYSTTLSITLSRESPDFLSLVPYSHVLLIGIGYLLVGIFAQKLSGAARDTVLGLIACILACTGAIILLLANSASIVLLILGCVTSAAGEVLLFMIWYKQIAKCSIKEILISLAIANLIAPIVILLFSYLFISTTVVLIVLCLLPIISLIPLYIANSTSIKTPVEMTTPVNQKEEGFNKAFGFSVLPIALLITFSMSNGFARSSVDEQALGFTLVGVVLISLVIIVVTTLKTTQLSISFLWYLAVPLCIIGLVGVDSSNRVFSTFAALCSNSAQVCFSIFVVIVLCNASFRYGLNALRLIGFAMSAVYLSEALLDVVATYSYATLHINSDFYKDALIIIVTIISVIFIADRRTDLTQKMVSSHNLYYKDDNASLFWICVQLSRQYGLTQREEEIVVYLLKGWTSTAIADELFVAQSTVKSHIKHIYAKLDIHSKNELMDKASRIKVDLQEEVI